MKNWEPIKTKAILASVEKIFQTKDIKHLTEDAYKLIMNMSGFIAHYDRHGFMHNYEDLRELINDLLRSYDCTNPERMIRDKWFQNQYGIAYCKSKVDAYKGICKLAEKYQNSILSHEVNKKNQQEITEASVYTHKHGFKLVKS